MMVKELNTILLNLVGRTQHKFNGDRTIWIIVSLLFIISMVAVYSATGIIVNIDLTSTSFFIKQFLFIVIGFFVIFQVHKLDYQIFLRITPHLFIASIILLIITLFLGENINGARRWLSIPFINIQFQPSDIVKVSLVLYLAKQLSQYQKEQMNYKTFCKIYVTPILLTVGLVMPENLSTALLIAIISLILLFVGRVNSMHLLKTVGLLFILPISIILILSINLYDSKHAKFEPIPKILQISRLPTWIRRVQGFLYEKTGGHNYQIQQAKIAIVEGGWVGKGPGNSEQRYFLPSSYSDFVYSILIEEYGLIGGIIILTLYILLFFRIIKVFIKCDYAFGGFIVIGLGLMIVLQALINVCVNVGLIPNTGITLPLISMGGTSYLISCFAIAIILSVAKTINTAKDSASLNKNSIKNED